jgi:hypothetical protein
MLSKILKIKALPIAATALASCLSSHAFALQADSYNADQAYGSIAGHPVLDSAGNETPETQQTTILSNTDQIETTWLASAEGVNLYSDAKCTDTIGTAKFLEEFYSVWENSDTVLLGKSENPEFDSSIPSSGHVTRIAGYAKRNDFVESQAGEPAYYCQKTESNIASKAMTVHKWEDNEATERAKVVNAPSESANELDQINLYDINYVYLTHGVDSTDPTKPAFYLLGRTPYIMRGTGEVDSIRGWVSGKRIFNWDHRQAIEFNKDADALNWRTEKNLPIRFYGSVEDAIASEDELYEEDLTAPAWEYFKPRYPIITTQDNAQGIVEAGVIGDSYSGDRTITSTTESDLQRMLEEVEREMQSLDILLVIDATGSMAEFYASIGQSIDKIQTAIDSEGLVARYAVSYYRDYTEDSDPNSWSHYYQDFRGAAEFRELFNPTSNTFIPSGGGQMDPCPFAGIINGVNSVNWEPNSTRVVILIGDQGNTTATVTNTFESRIPVDPDLAEFMQADPQGNDLAKVIRTMQQFKIDIFFSIQTMAQLLKNPSLMDSGEPILDKFMAYSLREFNNQSRLIQKALGTETFLNVLDAYSTNLTEQISEAVSVLTVTATTLKQTLQLLKEGKSADEATLKSLSDLGLALSTNGQSSANYNGGQYGLFIKDSALERAAQKGIDVDLLLKERVQNFAFAFAAQNLEQSPYPQLKTTILMTKSEAEALLAAIGIVERQSMTAENVDRIWRGIVNSLIGEHEDSFTFDETKPLSEYFSKSLGLPARSEYLRKSIRELKSLTPAEIAKWNAEIKEKIQGLRNFINDKSIDGLGTEKHVFAKNGFDYAYIPIELFP